MGTSISVVKFVEVQVLSERVCVHVILIILQNYLWLKLYHISPPPNVCKFISPHPNYHNVLYNFLLSTSIWKAKKYISL